jgi:hypothetical protein
LKEFRGRVDEALGGSVLSDAHVENVLRTNTAVAYSQGLEKVATHEMVVDEFPFRENLPITDSRLTPLCEVISRSGLDGTAIYYYADPVWQKFRVPRHWNCRCGTGLLNLEDAAARGVKAAQLWLKTGEPPTHRLFVQHPPVELPKGWTPGGGELGTL